MTTIAQDLVHSDVHLYLGDNDIAGWETAVEALGTESGCDTILAGHGLPSGPEVYAEVRRYLADAREFLGGDGEAYKAAIVDKYPTASARSSPTSPTGPCSVPAAERAPRAQRPGPMPTRFRGEVGKPTKVFAARLAEELSNLVDASSLPTDLTETGGAAGTAGTAE
ncbi:hypothetical protein [Streptomyces massasporeus]|uniref:hypothetical protein n=1 Tax=Streptomyces massasporeus TaxID=67324 RepID=UPI0019CA83CC|nr:hypothetical protein [Streptomyces massasporeus]GGV57434.1 hypothetical protein GCM10010228_02130 [Streptomyces massasporeus]